MTQADFYILAGQSIVEQWTFACRLIEKVSARGHEILLQVNSEQEALAFDTFLWEYKAESFIPHTIIGDKHQTSARLHINWLPDPAHHHDVLINMSSELPYFYSRFERLVEIVIQEDKVLEATRQHYRFLKDRGYPIQYQDMRMR